MGELTPLDCESEGEPLANREGPPPPMAPDVAYGAAADAAVEEGSCEGFDEGMFLERNDDSSWLAGGC